MSAPWMKTAVQEVMVLARKLGATEVGASAAESRNLEVTWRDGRLEKLSDATARALSLQLYVEGRYSAVSTSDLRPEAKERFVRDAVAMTRALAPDPFRALPDPSLYEGRQALDLELEDLSYSQLTPERRRELAQALEAAARGHAGKQRLNSVTATVSDRSSALYRAHSNGFEGEQKDTSFSMGAMVSVTDQDGRRPSNGAWATCRLLADLPGVEELGRLATERTLARLGAQKGKSAALPMVVENRVAGLLVRHLIAPLSAAALQQKRSCFDGKLGTVVGSPLLDVADDPHLRRGLGSRLFDSEGITARRLPLFEGGALRGYLVDNYYGRKLKLSPTTGQLSNLSWKLGARPLAALLSELQDGMLVTGFLGGNSNATSGDFSLGVEGFRIRKGQRAEPFAEMNLAGNHLVFWKRLREVGNDPYQYSSWRTPSLVFDAVQFSGA